MNYNHKYSAAMHKDVVVSDGQSNNSGHYTLERFNAHANAETRVKSPSSHAWDVRCFSACPINKLTD